MAKKIIVIGSGFGGLAAALRMRAKGFAVTLGCRGWARINAKIMSTPFQNDARTFGLPRVMT